MAKDSPIPYVPTQAKLAESAYLFHVERCKACSSDLDVIELRKNQIHRLIRYVPCPTGKFLGEIWEAAAKEV